MSDDLGFDPVTMEPRAVYLKHLATTLSMGIVQTREGEALRLLADDYLALRIQSESSPPVVETLTRERDEARADNAALLQIATGFDDDDRDYERVNNLHGCENNHWRTQLREYKARGGSGASLLSELSEARSQRRGTLVAKYSPGASSVHPIKLDGLAAIGQALDEAQKKRGFYETMMAVYNECIRQGEIAAKADTMNTPNDSGYSVPNAAGVTMSDFLKAHQEEIDRLEIERDELVKALGDLSFECFSPVAPPNRPSLETYNRTFEVLDRIRNAIKSAQPQGETP